MRTLTLPALRSSALLAAALLVVAGCGDDVSPPASSADAGNTGCVPGQSEFCACPGGTQGVQTCQSDGTFSACDCNAEFVDTGVADTSADTGVDDTGTSDTGTLDTSIILPDTTPPEPTCGPGRFQYNSEEANGLMYPGEACVECHNRGEGPTFAVGGTVMPNLHENEGCVGIQGATVEILNTNGDVQVTLTSGRTGNFYLERTRITYPYRARVTYQGRTSEMLTEASDRDCNSCHTTFGEQDAPGRIYVP